MRKEQNVLSLCNHNSARSEMTEGFLQALGDSGVKAFSAGLDHRSLSDGTIRAMNEIGIDISEKRSKSAREFMGREVIHHAIFLCSESEDDCSRISPFGSNTRSRRIPASDAWPGRWDRK